MEKIFFEDFTDLQRGFDLPENQREEGEFPVVASTDIVGYHNQFKVMSPCVVTGRSGSLGFVQLISKPCFPLNTTLFVKNFKGNDPHFVYYFLKTLKLEQYNSGAGVPTLNRNDLDKIKIKIPTPPIQRRISEVLGRYDALIENYQRQIGILEATAQTLYREWFMRGRCPHAAEDIVESVYLHEMADINRRSISEQDEHTLINYLDISSVGMRRINEVTSSLLKDAPGRARRWVAHGDIIFSTVRPENKSYALILLPVKNLVASTGFAVITPKKSIYTCYLYCQISSDAFVAEASNKAKGAAYPQVGFDDLMGIKIKRHSDEVLAKFDEVATNYFLKIGNLQSQITVLRQMRDRLLPRLMSGQIPLEMAATE